MIAPALPLNGQALASSPAPDSSVDLFPAPLDETAFYGPAGEIVRSVGPETEADAPAMLVQLLAAVGNLVGRAVYLSAGGERHHLNLFSVLVGSTSKGRKGTSWAAVRPVAEALDGDWKENRIQTGLSSGEGLVWAVRDPIYKDEPIKKDGRRTRETETVCVDPGVSDKRLFVIEGEFASVLQVMSREKNTLSATLRQAWDGHKLSTLTKNSPAAATGAHISIVGHITREELRRLLTATDSANGFANRFLWVATRRSKSLPEGGNLPGVDLAEPLHMLQHVRANAGKLGELRRTAEARALWAEVYPDLSEGKAGLLGAVTSRAEAQVLRLSGLYALLDGAARVEADHLRAALALWDYCEESARWIFGTATGSRDADEILAALQRAGAKGLTKTDISEGVFQRNRKAGQIEQALRLLSVSSLADCREEKATGGAPAHRWFVAGLNGSTATKLTN